MHCPLLFLFALACAAASTPNGCVIQPARLTTEYRASLPPRPSLFIDTARPVRFGWWLLPLSPTAANQSQSAYEIQVATDSAFTSVLWDTGKVASNQSVAVPYAGPALPDFALLFWHVRVWDADGTDCGWSNESGAWGTVGSWAGPDGAQWITQSPPGPPPTTCKLYALNPAPRFRRELTVDAAQVQSAHVYVSGLGYYELRVDGAIVSYDLDPGWTSYNKTVLYSVYDVTDIMQRSNTHAIGVTLGNGWWNLLPLEMWGGRNFREALAHGPPMFALQLRVRYVNGSLAVLNSDPAWRTGLSPLLKNSIYLGDSYDSRMEEPGWDTPGFDDHRWRLSHVATLAFPPEKMKAQVVPPVRRTESLAAKPIDHSADGVVYDVGRNIAGICTICAAGRAGSKIDFLYGELRFPNGTVNGLTSVAGQIKHPGMGGQCAPDIAYQMDHLTLNGSRVCWTPEFTWHGFRYIQVSGDAEAVSSIVCYPMRSDLDVISSFESSSALLNSIHTLDVNTAAANLMSVQSDCPHRERLGYSGDVLMSAESLLLNFDMTLFYEKRVHDYVDAQRANGGFTETAPFVGVADAGLGDDSGPIGWQTVVPVLTAWLLRYHGNAQLAQQAWPALKGYVRLLDTRPAAIEEGLGDWMALEEKALPLTGLGFVYMSYLGYANVSDSVGAAGEARQYRAAARSVADEINQRFLNTTSGEYRWDASASRSQCGQAMPLALQIVPPASRAVVIGVLLDVLQASKNHFQVGSFGIKWLLQALADNGLADVAVALLLQEDYPSFAYMMNNPFDNATTIWESWFFSNSTFSHNHPMFSSAEVFFFQHLAGLQPHPAALAFDRVLIKPRPVRALEYVKASYDSVRGTVDVRWSWSGADTLELDFIIPPNMHADVFLPDGTAPFVVGSGSYSFTVQL